VYFFLREYSTLNRGEVYVQNASMATCYYKDPKRTQEAFVDGFFRTGDIAEVCKYWSNYFDFILSDILKYLLAKRRWLYCHY
jgi:long-subunit acyl-CoA synthetase (AMP-forming)